MPTPYHRSLKQSLMFTCSSSHTTRHPLASISKGWTYRRVLPRPTSPLPSSDPYSSPVLKSAFLWSQSVSQGFSHGTEGSKLLLLIQVYCCTPAHLSVYYFTEVRLLVALIYVYTVLP